MLALAYWGASKCSGLEFRRRAGCSRQSISYLPMEAPKITERQPRSAYDSPRCLRPAPTSRSSPHRRTVQPLGRAQSPKMRTCRRSPASRSVPNVVILPVSRYWLTTSQKVKVLPIDPVWRGKSVVLGGTVPALHLNEYPSFGTTKVVSIRRMRLGHPYDDSITISNNRNAFGNLLAACEANPVTNPHLFASLPVERHADLLVGPMPLRLESSTLRTVFGNLTDNRPRRDHRVACPPSMSNRSPRTIDPVDRTPQRIGPENR